MARRASIRFFGFMLLITLLLALPLSGTAAPRYPTKTDLPVSDNANIFPEQTVFDLNTFHDTLKNKTGVKLWVVSVHFLDGMNASDFGREVFRQWNLSEDDLLMLISAGDEECATVAGPGLAKLFSQDSQQFLLNSYFLNDFQNERYDTAFRQYIPQLATALGKQYGVTVSMANLFGIPAAAPTPVPTVVPPSKEESGDGDISNDWMEYLPGGSKFFAKWDQAENTPAPNNYFREEKSSGFSLGSLFVLFLLFSLIFGSKKRRLGRRAGCCGCGPLGWLIAGLGMGEIVRNRRRW